MRLYTRAEEQRVRLHASVQEWIRSGLLDPSQRAGLDADLRLDLRRTNPFLRAGLALFTAFTIGASVALIFVTLNLRGEGAAAVTTGIAALVCLALAGFLISAYRLYHFGVEETLAEGAVILLMVSGVTMTMSLNGGRIGQEPAIVGLLVGAAAGFGGGPYVFRKTTYFIA